MHRLSASRRWLGRLCLYWARDDVAIPPDAFSSAADLGSATHEVGAEEGEGLEWALHPGVDLTAVAERWKLSDRQRQTLEGLVFSWRMWWSEFSQGRDWRTEVPFAFDTATGGARQLVVDDQRKYVDIRPTEIPGTIDAVWIATDLGGAVVLDLKTGRPPKLAADYLDQLLHTAVCVRQLHGVERVRVIIAHVTTTDVFPDWIDLDGFDLDLAAAEMRKDLAGLAEAQPKPGPHCSRLYCPALAWCPATTASIVRGLPLSGPVQTELELEQLLDDLPKLEAWLEDRKRAVRAACDERGGSVVLPSGRLYRSAEEQRETLRLDVNGAEDAIRSVLGDFANHAIDRKTSKSAIEGAVRALLAQRGSKRGDLARLKSEVVEAMRRAGAVKLSRFTSYEVVEPKALEKAG